MIESTRLCAECGELLVGVFSRGGGLVFSAGPAALKIGLGLRLPQPPS